MIAPNTQQWSQSDPTPYSLLPTPTIETFEELPEMHPLDFRDYWGLTNEEAAYYLRVTAAAINSYETNILVKRRNPSLQVMGLAGELHQKWLAANRPKKLKKKRQQYSGVYNDTKK